MKNNVNHITILGGGLAGLSVGYYAKKNKLPFTIYESDSHVGGNCRTFKYKDFFYDSGAHRLHDKDSDVTEEMKKLLGDDLRNIDIPTQIYNNDSFINFPLSTINLMKNLGLVAFTKASMEILYSKFSIRDPYSSFEDFALYSYGKTIADRFLLNYSEKLWGKSCKELTASIAGKRLKGINIMSFIKEILFGKNGKSEHLEGSFYYPNGGINDIANKMEEFCGISSVIKNSKITTILHDSKRITGLKINNNEKIYDVNQVASTLPVNLFLELMKPAPPKEILLLSKELEYRNIILVAIFLDKESVTKSATVYFPDSEYPFTRVYEPRNRSKSMAPLGKTSLVAEIPCSYDENFWRMSDEGLVNMVISKLYRIGWISKKDIIDTDVKRLCYAYPILTAKSQEKMKKINLYLEDFSNLKISGRSGKFMYSWIHDMVCSGKEIINEFKNENSNT